MKVNDPNQPQNILGGMIFFSRWLQAPLYLGLIVAQGVYVWRFMLELWHLIGFSFFDHPAAGAAAGAKDAETSAQRITNPR